MVINLIADKAISISYKRIIVSILLILLTVMLFILQNAMINSAKMILPTSHVFRSQSGLQISHNEIQDVMREKDNIVLSAVSIKLGFVTGEFTSSTEAVNLILTDETYPKLIPLDIIRGTYFELSNVPQADNFIVISEDMSIKYFKNDKSIGQTLNIDGMPYIICGVYKQNNSIATDISSNGIDNIYLPYTSVNEYEKLPVNFLYAKSDNKTVSQSLEYDIISITGNNLGYDNQSSYSDSLKLISQSISITFFICSLIIILTLIYFFIKYSKRLYLTLKHNMSEGVYQNKIIVRKAVICVALVMAIILIFIAFKFDFYIPPNMLPDDNIFDLKFYYELIVSAIQKRNNYPPYDFHWNYSFAVMTQTAITAILSFVAFVIAYCHSFKTVKTFINSRKQ